MNGKWIKSWTAISLLILIASNCTPVDKTDFPTSAIPQKTIDANPAVTEILSQIPATPITPTQEIAAVLPVGIYTNEKGWTVTVTFDSTAGEYAWTATLPAGLKTPNPVSLNGTFTVDSGIITVKQDSGPCKDMDGKYSWEYDEGTRTLSIKFLDDNCSDRADNAPGKWYKQ
jgi:hypothetical protein